MNWKREWKSLAGLLGLFLACVYLPIDLLRFPGVLGNAVLESFRLVRWYAREHVLLCLVPAFFIAGAIAVFVSHASIMKYLGPTAKKAPAYGVASVSGTILAVCSCTVLPLFAGIYRMGAGLGPATTFLYSGPAINVLAIILTARVLGLELGAARAFGAILFSIALGVAMHLIFRKEELEKANARIKTPAAESARPLWQTALFFGAMTGILIFANWGNPGDGSGFWHAVYSARWIFTALSAAALGLILVFWIRLHWIKLSLTAVLTAVLALFFHRLPMIPFAAAVVGLSWATASDDGEGKEWFSQSWGFAKQIMLLLLAGVLVAGFLFGRPGHEALLPSTWVAKAVGGNTFWANLFASLAGAFMYFATLTEVPILQGLIGAGMGKGPALALLLAGPAVSLPNMLIIRSVMGAKKTAVFVGLVIVMATIAGMTYGALFAPARSVSP